MSRLLKQSGHTRWMPPPPVSFILITPSGQQGSDRVPPLPPQCPEFMRMSTLPPNLMEVLPSHRHWRLFALRSFHLLISYSKCACAPHPRQLGPRVSGVRTHTFPLSSTCDLAVIPASPRPATLPPLLTVKRIMKQKKGQAQQIIVLFIKTASLFQRKLDISQRSTRFYHPSLLWWLKIIQIYIYFSLYINTI